MPRLRHTDLRKLTDYIGECYVLRSQQALAEHLVTSLGQLVPGDIIAYNEICTEKGKALARWAPSNVRMIPNGFEILAKHAIENPVVPYFEKTRDGSPKKVTDFIPLSKFQKCSLRNEFYLPFRIRYHMSTSLLCGRKGIVTLTSHRWGKDYSESERMLLGLLRPHLIQAMTNSRLYGEAVEDARSRMVALGSIERALLSVKTNGTIRWLTRSAVALCRKYSLFLNRSEDRLSVAMCEWMRKPESAGGLAAAGGCIPLTVHGPHGRVSLRVLSRTPQTLLAIEEYSNHNSLEKLRSFGLSPRRTEILRWIAEGKSNPEIASILSISVRTVAKHIEKLYQDLGVETGLRNDSTSIPNKRRCRISIGLITV